MGKAIAATYPQRFVEAINVSGVSYAMHRLGFVADEIMAYEPDILIIYSGHNEFVEPTFYKELKHRSPQHNRLEHFLSHSRIYSAMHALLRPSSGRGLSPEARFEMFVQQNESTTFTPLQKKQVVDQFRVGLSRIVKLAHQRGARVVLATVPANLSRWRPNHSIIGSPLGEARRSDWAIALETGNRLIKARRFKQAVSSLSRTVDIAPDHAESQYLLGQVHEGAKDWDRARHHYRLACDADASPIRRLSAVNRAIAAVATQENSLLVDIDSIIEQRSDNQLIGFEFIEDYVHPTPGGHRLIAWNLCAAMDAAGWFGGDRKASLTVFDKILSEQKKIVNAMNPTWLFNQGYMLARQGQTQQAITKYRETLAIAPQYEAAMVNLAHLLIGQSEDEQAGAVLAHLLTRFPDNVGGRIMNGVILAHEGKKEEAMEAFSHVIEASPDSVDAYLQLGNLLLSENRLSEAQSAFGNALTIEENDLTAKLGLAQISERRNAPPTRSLNTDRCSNCTPRPASCISAWECCCIGPGNDRKGFGY